MADNEDRRSGEDVVDWAIRTHRFPEWRAPYWRDLLAQAGPSRVVASAGGAARRNAVEELIEKLHPVPPISAADVDRYLAENP